MKKIYHKSVLLHESIKSLNIKPNGFYIDATFGQGGHSKLILSKLHKKGHLLAIDKDPKSKKIANQIKDKRFLFKKCSFSNLNKYILKKKLKNKINGILIDLGLSSIQIEDPKRGFSFKKKNNGPLDMRYNNNTGITAKKWLNTTSKKKITLILKKYGEEKLAKKIANKIIYTRIKKPICTTQELSKIISNVKHYYTKKNPATKIFQAIRIYINQEIKELKKCLITAFNALKNLGRLSIISFNSIESKIIKKFFYKKSLLYNKFQKFPITKQYIHKYQKNKFYFKIFKKIKPSAKEIKKNPKARSAILRYAEKKIYN